MKRYVQVVAALTGAVWVLIGVLILLGTDVGGPCNNHMGRGNCSLQWSFVVLFGKSAANLFFGLLWIAAGIAFIRLPHWIDK